MEAELQYLGLSCDMAYMDERTERRELESRKAPLRVPLVVYRGEFLEAFYDRDGHDLESRPTATRI